MAQQRAKSKWPELVGKTYEEAKKAILEDNPNLQVVEMPENSVVTTDFRTDRVRVKVNADDVVVAVPKTG